MQQFRLMSDVYEGNGTFDVNEYADSGRTIIALKASEGNFHVDRDHAQRTLKAHDRHLSVVHYHFARPEKGQDPIGDAINFVRVVRPHFNDYDYLCCDIEEMARGGQLNTAEWVEAFCTRVHRELGHYPVVYCGESFGREFLRTLKVPGERYWVAKYGPGHPDAPHGERVWAWQFTDGQEGPPPHEAPGLRRGDDSQLPLRFALVLRTRLARRRWRARHQGR